jgi:predicted translin family RNA/ssDNA-binding protein
MDMIIPNEQMEEVASVMRDLEDKMRKSNKKDHRIARIKNELRHMSKMRMTIQRRGNFSQIAKFNKQFSSRLVELSGLLREHGGANRDDVARLIRNSKQI